MEPGHKLDAVVAEKVMGWKNVGCLPGGNIPFGEPNDDYNHDYPTNPHREEVPHCSSDLMAAGWVIDEMRKKGYDFMMGTCAHGTTGMNDSVWAMFGKRGEEGEPVGGTTFPHAICQAALKVVESL